MLWIGATLFAWIVHDPRPASGRNCDSGLAPRTCGSATIHGHWKYSRGHCGGWRYRGSQQQVLITGKATIEEACALMTATQAIPAVGPMVRVRSRQYLVDGVQEGGTGEQTLVRMSCIDDDAQGFGLEVLWQREVDARILDDAAWHAPAWRSW